MAPIPFALATLTRIRPGHLSSGMGDVDIQYEKALEVLGTTVQRCESLLTSRQRHMLDRQLDYRPDGSLIDWEWGVRTDGLLLFLGQSNSRSLRLTYHCLKLTVLISWIDNRYPLLVIGKYERRGASEGRLGLSVGKQALSVQHVTRCGAGGEEETSLRDITEE